MDDTRGLTMDTFSAKLRFTQDSVATASLNAIFDIRSAAARVLTLGVRGRLALIGGGAVLYLGAGSAVTYAAACGDVNGATSPIVDLFARVALLIITIGGIGSIVMGVFGALVIMFSGGNTSRAKTGMTIVKNCVIALGIMGGVFLIRYVVVTFMSGSSSAIMPDKSTGCASQLTQGNLGS